jgi:Protein of unknown function (DUF4019)
MAILKFDLMKFTLLLVGFLCFAFVALPQAHASAEDHINDALVASTQWLAQIDAGQYDQSYDAGSEAMHTKVPESTWSEVLNSLRNPWGAVVNRKQVSHIYKPDGYEGAEGEFLVITYDTSFKKLNPATEVVVLRWEDGKWRGAGYNARAVVSPGQASDDATSSSTTETQTQHHVKPQAQ